MYVVLEFTAMLQMWIQLGDAHMLAYSTTSRQSFEDGKLSN